MGQIKRLRRRKSEYATIQPVPLRICAVSFADVRGIRHTVEVQAESLFEAAILEQRHPALEFLHADNELVARFAEAEAQQSFYLFDHTWKKVVRS